MSRRETITIFCSVLNEKKNLEVFLKKHQWADEILVFDSGSTDGSIELCQNYGCMILPNKLNANYNQRTAAGLAKARSEWVFLSDPDEEITEDLRKEIIDILEKGTRYTAFRNKRINFFMGKPLHHGGWSGYGLKMFRKEKGRCDGDSYHEKPIIDGEIGQLCGEVYHYPNPNIHWILQKFNYISEFDCKSYFDQHGELTEKKFKRLLFTKPLKNFWKSYIKKKGYKDGMHGLIYAAMIFAFDVIRICKYGERYIVKNPDVQTIDQLPDPWACRKQ